ncbi:MAG: hypothetical protein RH859_01225 [Longimicrobiales bacterium]
MSLTDWLSERQPAPPPTLARRLAALGADGVSDGTASDTAEGAGSVRSRLERAGLTALDAARAAPGRERESAWALLMADALLTYAAEAALDEDDPDAALEAMMARAAAPDR